MRAAWNGWQQGWRARKAAGPMEKEAAVEAETKAKAMAESDTVMEIDTVMDAPAETRPSRKEAEREAVKAKREAARRAAEEAAAAAKAAAEEDAAAAWYAMAQWLQKIRNATAAKSLVEAWKVAEIAIREMLDAHLRACAKRAAKLELAKLIKEEAAEKAEKAKLVKEDAKKARDQLKAIAAKEFEARKDWRQPLEGDKEAMRAKLIKERHARKAKQAAPLERENAELADAKRLVAERNVAAGEANKKKRLVDAEAKAREEALRAAKEAQQLKERAVEKRKAERAEESRKANAVINVKAEALVKEQHRAKVHEREILALELRLAESHKATCEAREETVEFESKNLALESQSLALSEELHAKKEAAVALKAELARATEMHCAAEKAAEKRALAAEQKHATQLQRLQAQLAQAQEPLQARQGLPSRISIGLSPIPGAGWLSPFSPRAPTPAPTLLGTHIYAD